ncbi:Putative uncharacterized protein [Moritella viscosa]|uniref:hypothetical protein n=2 Tax=Moritella viscosa TaxID=80854 RepID=UPI000698822C|nr:hypothetical protein [Moritella viscosa]SHN99637.1 Putative uncharacterized protein [Moritella viscosa]SHN99643.1 Putative uncharacterized protein [Moritella viscosa]SHO02323.1 Putative uncharacterized protein [Moritella viscosa]SHO18007.1 Putative uncharacterized protein [Moritella viscosa]SHO23930.1 Putative uncharacterized protein [Moritella viscosa]
MSNPENDYANKDTLKILPSTNALDGSEIVACSWEIGNINVSDNCEYKLAENEHLSPITVSVKLTYNGMTSKTLTKTFNKAFPIEQVSNSYSKVTLFNNGEVLEWDHILDDSELAYHAEHRFEKIPVNENMSIKKIFATNFAFAGIKEDGSFYLWGPKTKNDAQITSINSEGINKVHALNKSFIILTNVGNVYLIGKDSHVEQLNISNIINIFGVNNSIATESSSGDTCILNIDKGTTTCASLIGNIRSFSELNDYYLGNYAILTDLGYLYRWGSLAKEPAELVEQNIKKLINNDNAYAYLTLDNSVGAWGNSSYGGSFVYDYYTFEKKHFEKSKVCVSKLYGDDPVCGWGKKQITVPAHYKPVKKVTHYNLVDALINVKTIVAASQSFAALTLDGKVITWGSVFSGGNIYSDTVNHTNELNNIVDITANVAGYSAIGEDGKVISWQGIWDLDVEIVFGEYNKYYYYDSNRPSHVNFLDLYSVGVVDGVNQFKSNDGAYLFAKEYQSTKNSYSMVNTWGYKDFGGGFNLKKKKIAGKIDRVISRKKGFTIYTDNGSIYDIENERGFRQIATSR